LPTVPILSTRPRRTAAIGPREIASLAERIDERYRAVVLVGGYGGLRAGELFGLRRGRVDLMRGRGDVAETLVEVRGHYDFGTPKTRAAHRAVPLSRSIIDVLAAHVAGLACALTRSFAVGDTGLEPMTSAV